MTQIAIIQAMPQSMPTGTTLTKDKPNVFIPHLEKATAETKTGTSGTISKIIDPISGQPFRYSPPLEAALEASEFLLDADVLADIPSTTDVDYPEENPFGFLSVNNAAGSAAEELTISGKGELLAPGLLKQKESPLNPAEKPSFLRPAGQMIPLQSAGQEITTQPAWQQLSSQPAKEKINVQLSEQDLTSLLKHGKTTVQPTDKHLVLEGIGKPSPSFSTGMKIADLSGDKNGSEPFIQTILSSRGSEKIPGVFPSLSPVEPPGSPLKMDMGISGSLRKNNTPSQIAQNQTILSQLQQIINNGNKTDTVSVQETVSTYPQHYQGETGIKLAGRVSGQTLDLSKITEKSVSKIPTLRQDMVAQYFDAKVNTKQQGDVGPNTQNSDQQNSPNGQQPATVLQSNTSLSPDQSSGFQHISTLMQDMQSGQTENSSKPVLLPSGMVVDEDNVMQQVIERFHISNRASDTRLSLKLHPEELGELKIDLTVKEGSIKANVIVQNQHVLEIIEKNMIKLRNVLEELGYSIENIAVTSGSDSVQDFNLFEQHLSQQQDFSPSSIDPQSLNNFDVALEEAVEQSAGASTGINIQA